MQVQAYLHACQARDEAFVTIDPISFERKAATGLD